MSLADTRRSIPAEAQVVIVGGVIDRLLNRLSPLSAW